MFSMLPLGSSIFLCLVISASGKLVEQNEKYLQFPPNFLLGAATAAYQIEGAWNVSDKGESVWDRFSHERGNHVYHNETGDVAANSYYKYKEDIAILKNLGFKSYRLSLSWPRILPTGYPNKISVDGIQYYHKVIDDLLANNIEPMVTLYHWDHPQILEDAGGWTNSEMVEWFADYARVVFKEFAPKIKRFIPVNEPQEVCRNGYLYGNHAPGKRLHGVGEYLCLHNVLKAHARTYRIYEKEFKEQYKGEVGILNNVFGYFPKTPKDEAAAEIAFQFNGGWVLNPIYNGDYPAVMKEFVAKRSREQGFTRSRLPEFDAEWIKYIRGTADFLALNHYTSRIVENGTYGEVPSQDNDQMVLPTMDESWKSSASKWLKVVPEGFRLCLRKLAEHYGNPPIYITESGFSDRGTLNDDDRIDYYREYLKQMLLAHYVDGVNVRGYLLWSLLDNFEWDKGYNERFGIVSIDFNDPNRPRTLKKSATWWQKIISDRKLDQ
ncbi:myrosinase 1 [Osmia bicornis bicornis]|uniref:myrosinase 1 n=1 Tax=Osmia bicornis bicornis TaxID=1437191 RepID=UPI001EAEBD3A|nr:myrosinase 1 [Osmia bicornis bicornis]XP_029040201.2 myrosinase 1 [Osmia bicornis bicornis]